MPGPFLSTNTRPDTGGKASGKGARNRPVGRDKSFPYDRTDPDKQMNKPGAIGKGENHREFVPRDAKGPAWEHDYWNKAREEEENPDELDKTFDIVGEAAMDKINVRKDLIWKFSSAETSPASSWKKLVLTTDAGLKIAAAAITENGALADYKFLENSRKDAAEGLSTLLSVGLVKSVGPKVDKSILKQANTISKIHRQTSKPATGIEDLSKTEAMGVPSLMIGKSGNGSGGSNGGTVAPGTGGRTWSTGNVNRFEDDEEEEIPKMPIRGNQFGDGPTRMRGMMGPQRESAWYALNILEARFPDEKFWKKDGSAIHPKPKGPPKGTVGRTSADFGVKEKQTLKELFDEFDKLTITNHGRMSNLNVNEIIEVAEKILYHEKTEDISLGMELQQFEETRDNPSDVNILMLINNIQMLHRLLKNKKINLDEAFVSLKKVPSEPMTGDSMDLKDAELDSLRGEFQNVFTKTLDLVSQMEPKEIFHLIIDLDPDFAAQKFVGELDSNELTNMYKSWGAHLGGMPTDVGIDKR